MGASENFSLAPIGRRAVAYAIDDTLMTLVFLVAFWDRIAGAATPEALLVVLNQAWLPVVMAKIAYHSLFVWQYGASLGKIAMGLRVVELSGRVPPRFGVALNRAIFRVVSEMVMYIGFVFAFFDPKKQTLHDKTSSTVVVHA